MKPWRTWSAELGQHAQVGIHTHDDAGVGVANSLVAVERGARMVQGTMNGYGERCGNANLITILVDLQLKLGYECVAPERLEHLVETAHLVDELCNVAPNPDQPYVGANAFAHKGGMHVAGVNRDARTFEHIDPAAVGADRRLLISELSGRGTVQARADQTGVDLGQDGAAHVSERVKELEHRGYHLEAADGSFDLLIRRQAGVYEPLFRLESWRCIVEKREDGKVETEATIKIWVDGERYVRTAEGNGPVHALDKALRDAIGETYPAPARHRARELQGAHPGRDQGHGSGHARAAGRQRRPRDLGRHRRFRERHRSQLGGAGRLARGRHAAGTGRPRPRPGRRAADAAVTETAHQAIPLAGPVIGAREEQLVLQTLRSGQIGIGPRVAEFERGLGARLEADHVSAISSGTAALHLAVRGCGIEAGDEVVTSPFSFVASANCVLYEEARPVFCDIDPRTLNIAPDAAAAAVTEHTTGLLPVHIFGYPADMAGFERLASERGLWIVEDACEALGAVHEDGVAVGARGNPAAFGFYPNKQLATGEGGALIAPDAAFKAAVDSERNQGRSPDMGWLDHDRLGFNYRLSALACALGVAQLERLDEMLAGRARAAELYRQALVELEGLELPCTDAGGDRRSWFVYVVQLPPGADRDGTIRALREQGIDSKPYLPAIHLMSFYRERFGHREGEFPVCEDVAARSLALPFFPGLSEGQVQRVAAALAQALGR